MFTRRSYLLLTVGVLTFISREMARKDFLPSSINDFRIATSVLSRSTGNARCNIVNANVDLIIIVKKEKGFLRFDSTTTTFRSH
jgi:hypothetical protein